MSPLRPVHAPTSEHLARSATPPRSIPTDERLSSFEELRQAAQLKQQEGVTPPGAPPPKAGQSGVMSEKDEAKLKKALADFEAIFLQQMLASMRKNVPEGGGLAGESSQGEKIFRDLLDSEYAKILSQGENRQGLKEAMFDQLTRKLKQGHVQPGQEGGLSASTREPLKNGAEQTMSSLKKSKLQNSS